MADGIRDDDRLPWLETADEDYDVGPSPVRVFALIVLALLIIACGVYAVYWYQHQPRGTDGKGDLIAAQEGDYKVKPEAPGGSNVQGEGEAAMATSQGKDAGGAIDTSQAPEAPILGKKAPPPKPAGKGASKIVTALTPAGDTGAAAGTSGGGSVVQLGSFPSSAAADAAWARMAKAYGYLAPLGKAVQKAEVHGATVYRLRVNAGSAGQAGSVCAKLKASGAACFIAKD